MEEEESGEEEGGDAEGKADGDDQSHSEETPKTSKTSKKKKKKPSPKKKAKGQKGTSCPSKKAKSKKSNGNPKDAVAANKVMTSQGNMEEAGELQGAEIDYYDKNTPEGFDPYVNRAKNRKRWTSRYWHYGFDEAKKQSKTHDECLAAAKKRSQAASLEFENLWPDPKKQKDDLTEKKEDKTKKRKAVVPKVTKKKKVTKGKLQKKKKVGQGKTEDTEHAKMDEGKETEALDVD